MTQNWGDTDQIQSEIRPHENDPIMTPNQINTSLFYERSFSESYLYMKPISSKSKASVVSSVTRVTYIDFALGN